MSYVHETLAPSEQVLAIAHFNWTYSFGTGFWLVVSALPLVATAYFDTTGQMPEVAAWVYWLSGISLALGILLVIGHLIHLKTTEIAVTTSRFVYKTGLVSRTTKEVSLNKIEEISLTQSVFGRLFGYGQLILRGTGVGVIELPDVDNPVELRRAIEGAKDNMRGRGGDVQDLGAASAGGFESKLAPKARRTRERRPR